MYNPRISIVAAMAHNRVIGKEGRIPWHITPDLVRFKEKCMGHTVIMGRKTFESLLRYYDKSGRPLPGKTYIVVTSDAAYATSRENCLVAHSFGEAITKAKEIEPEEIILAGGNSIFQEGMHVADRLYVTLVDLHVEGGDAFFPDYSVFAKELERMDSEYKGIRYTFLTLEK